MARSQVMEHYITLKALKINVILIMKDHGKMANKMEVANSLSLMEINTLVKLISQKDKVLVNTCSKMVHIATVNGEKAK